MPFYNTFFCSAQAIERQKTIYGLNETQRRQKMFKTLNETELMTVNGGGKYVRGYKVVWRGSYYEKVWVGPVWVSSDYPYSEIRVY